MTSRATFLALTTAASVRAAGFLDQGCAASQSVPLALEGSRISALCNDHICGVQASTVLDLNLCLGNDQGQLVARKNGNYADSCRDCQVTQDSGTLICACDDVSTGVTRISQFDLKADNTIYNWYGYLSCFGAHDDQTAAHDFSHCGAAAPAAGVWDPLSCDGCVSAPVGAIHDQQDQAHDQQDQARGQQGQVRDQQDQVRGQQDQVRDQQDQVRDQQGQVRDQQDQVGKAATKAGGRRTIARPQWKTPAAEQVQEAPAVDQAQTAQKGDDALQTAQKGDGVVKAQQVKAQQEPRGIATPPQVKAPVVNGEKQGSFFARRSWNQVQGKTATDTAQAGPVDQVQAAPAKVQDQQPDSIQNVGESRPAAVAGQSMGSHMMSPMEHAAYMQASQSVRRSSMPGQINAGSSAGGGPAGYHGEFPRPVTDQRQVADAQGADSVATQAKGGQTMMLEQQQQQPSRPVQGSQGPVADASTVVKALRGIRLGGGPVEGMGPAVHIVDGRQ